MRRRRPMSVAHTGSLTVLAMVLLILVPGGLAGQAIALGSDAPPADDLAALAWIAGHWAGEAFGGRVEEAWLGPDGRSMSGSFRLVRDDLAVMYELLLLEQDDDGEIYYRFKHVGRGWEPWEETPIEYRLTALEDRKATFRSTADHPSQNAPWWFTYERPDEDYLRVSIYGTEGEPTVLLMTAR